jgi:hypothetical protein
MTVTIWYHDPEEVNPKTSFVGLSEVLKSAHRRDWTEAPRGLITDLFDYARPDVVLSVDGTPVCSLELTNMNPSGHNIPQRFSCMARAAELGVPAILYYPEACRRRFSDPNVRYLNIRVPMANIRLIETYETPSLSVFWPTDQETKLPTTSQSDHQFLADLMELFIQWKDDKKFVLENPLFTKAVREMEDTISRYKGSSYKRNKTTRQFFPNGFPQTYAGEHNGKSVYIDPPGGAIMYETSTLISILENDYSVLPEWESAKRLLSRRKYSLVYKGTLSSRGLDSEHPYPGHLTMLDVLYCREKGGRSHSDREINVVYALPAKIDSFVERIENSINNLDKKPTATYIVDTFADILLLDGGAVMGKTNRVSGGSPQKILGVGRWHKFPSPRLY